MSTIIKVKKPVFLINLDNPTEISYTHKAGNWKQIVVPTFQHGIPTPNENEILYKYDNNRGYLYEVQQSKQIEVEQKAYTEKQILDFANWCRIYDNHYPNEVWTTQQLWSKYIKLYIKH
jgi:hypothetical protein